MKLNFIIVFCLISPLIHAQNITLDECLKMSRENYPLINDIENLDQQLELKLKTLNANYYPKLDFAVQYTWQNDVPGFNSPLPGMEIPRAPKQQYRAYVDLQQVIYDGGTTRAARQLEEGQDRADKMNVEVQLFGIRQRVIDSYYLILTLREQMKQLHTRQEVLKQRLSEMTSAVDNGVILQSEADQFEVELLKSEQDQSVLEEGIKAAIAILNTLTGKTMTQEADFILPVRSDDFLRPEYALFEARREQLASAQYLRGRERMPVLAGFGQLGYGNPGFNMLKDELATFYMVGVSLKWNIWDWKTSANQKSVLQLQATGISNQQAAFSRNLSLAGKEVDSRIRQLDRVLEKDDHIIALREKITSARLSQLDNGTITAADYIQDLNAESMARLAREIHLIERSKAEVQLAELGNSPER